MDHIADGMLVCWCGDWLHFADCGRTCEDPETPAWKTCAARWTATYGPIDGSDSVAAPPPPVDAFVPYPATLRTLDPTALYWSSDGMISCGDHAPGYGTDTWVTHSWAKMTAEERTLAGAVCETCDCMARRKASATDTRRNTKLVYSYRDASNYKTSTSCVLPGRFAPGEKIRFYDAIATASRAVGVEPTCFAPTELGLPPAQVEFFTRYGHSEDDHIYNDLDSIAPSDEPPTHALLAGPGELLRRAEAAAQSGWNVTAAMRALGLDDDID